MIQMPENSGDYWPLVEADPRDWSREQKILFWWVVGLLPQCSPDGVIAMPGQAPIDSDGVREVIEAILPETDDKRGERAFLDVVWTYKGQNVIVPTSDEKIVLLKAGNILLRPDDSAEEREKFN